MCKLIFGITGATGTGKSTMSEIFRELGVDVIDGDIASREVTENGSQCLAEITEKFGTDILFEDGSLNRHALGRVVFADSQKLAELTSITHRYIKELVLEKIQNSKSKICAIDGAVLIGSNMESLCEFMVAVVADNEIRKERIIARDDISETDAENRISSQEDEAFYRSHSDYIIENNGSREDLEIEVKELYKKILQERILH